MTWIRLDIDYDRTEWLRHEKRMVKDAWPNLLRLVKREAPTKARIKYRGVDDLAYAMRYELDEVWAVERMIEVATIGGAIKIEKGELAILNWAEFQSPEAERSRSRRESDETTGQTEFETVKQDLSRSNAECNGQTEFETVKPILTGSRASRDQATKQHTETTVSGSSLPAGQKPFERVQRVLMLAYSAIEGYQPPLAAEVRRYLKADSPVMGLISQFGEQGAADLFVLAESEWTNSPTWPSVFAQRNQLNAKLSGRPRGPNLNGKAQLEPHHADQKRDPYEPNR